MTVFGENPWLIWLCYAVAAMALANAVQLQFSMRSGGKPVRGVPLWREDLPEPVIEGLAGILPPAHYEGFDGRSRRLNTSLTLSPKDESIFLYVVRTQGKSPPAPFNGTLKRSASGFALQVNMSPLVPLIYLGLTIIVWTVLGGGWGAWLCAAIFVFLLLYTLYQSRQVLLDGLHIVKESNRVADPVSDASEAS